LPITISDGGHPRGPYKLRLTLGENVVEKKFDVAGTYMMEVASPRRRSHATVGVELVDANGIASFDAVAMSFNMHFYRTLKVGGGGGMMRQVVLTLQWMILVPFVVMVGVLMTVKDIRAVLLPF
jgi:hypothetical protein